MITDTTAERRFLLLKKRLDALHYCQPLTIESYPLVEKLLNDLVKTTEGFQQQKKQIEETKIQGVKNEQLLAPLKKEIGRLISENNSLHMAMIQVKEDCEFKDNKWRAQVRMLESERNDWKFMVSQKNTVEKKLQEDLITLRQTQERKLKGVENYDTNKQGDFEIKALKEEQRKWLDRIQEAQQQTMEANEQKRSIEMNSCLLEEKVKYLELQVENREKEVTRVKSKLDLGSVNLDKLSNDFQLQDQIQKCQRLTTQIDLITEENNRLNDELQSTKTTKKPATTTKKDSDKKSQQRIVVLQNEVEERQHLVEALKKKLDSQEQSNMAKVKSLSALNDELAGKAQRAEHLIQAYQSDKMAFNRTMDQMKGQKDSSEGALDDTKTQIQDMRGKMSELEDVIHNLKMQAQQIQREREIMERQHQRLLDENEIEREALTKLREVLRHQEREYDVQGSRVRELTSEVERLQTFLHNQDEQLGRLRSEQFTVKNDADNSQSSRQKLEQQLEALAREKELLLGSLRTNESLLQQGRRDTQLLDGELQEVKHERRILLDKSGQVAQQNARLQAQLELKTQECAKQENQLDDAQRQLAKARLDQTTHQDDVTRMQVELQNQLREAQNKTQQLQQDCQTMKLGRIESDEKVKHLEGVVQRLRQENDKLNARVNDYSDNSDVVQTSIKRAHDRENEYIIIVAELERVRDSERKLIIERERMSSDMARQDVSFANHAQKVDLMARQKEEMLKEIRQLRGDLQATKNTDHDTKNVSIKLSERLNSQESAMQEMRDLLQREQQRTAKATQELGEQRQLYLKAQAISEDLDAQLKQLRTLSVSLERSREELLTRLQAKNSEKMDEERNLSHTRTEKQQVADQLKTCEEELLATRRALEQVDRERDDMQTALDEKTELNVQAQQRIQKLEDALDAQQGKIVEVQSRGERGFETVAALEEKLRDMQFRSQKMANEIENLRYTLQGREKDVGELTSDLQILSRENQSLNAQLSRLAQDKDSHAQQQAYSQQQEVRVREQLRLTEMEMRDLQANYGEVCADNERLQSTLQQLSYQHQEVQARLAELQKEDDYLGHQMQSAQRKEESILISNAQLDRELQVVTRRCEEQERLLREAQRNQEQLHKEFNQQRRVSSGFQSNQEDLSRQLSNLEHTNKLQQDQVVALRREIEVKDSHLAIERQRANEVEQVLIYERENQMRINEEIHALRNQNEQLLVEMEKSQMMRYVPQKQDFGGISRVSGEVPYIDQQELVNEVSNLRIENNRLRSEQLRRSMDYQSIDKSQEEQQNNSRLDQSTGWDKLRMESENFKKSLSQAAISSQYLKMKMKGLAREYEVVLPPTQKY